MGLPITSFLAFIPEKVTDENKNLCLKAKRSGTSAKISLTKKPYIVKKRRMFSKCACQNSSLDQKIKLGKTLFLETLRDMRFDINDITLYKKAETSPSVTVELLQEVTLSSYFIQELKDMAKTGDELDIVHLTSTDEVNQSGDHNNDIEQPNPTNQNKHSGDDATITSNQSKWQDDFGADSVNPTGILSPNAAPKDDDHTLEDMLEDALTEEHRQKINAIVSDPKYNVTRERIMKTIAYYAGKNFKEQNLSDHDQIVAYIRQKTDEMFQNPYLDAIWITTNF